MKELVTEWRGRALEPFYPALFLDAPRVHIRYLALTIRLDGQKELLQ